MLGLEGWLIPHLLLAGFSLVLVLIVVLASKDLVAPSARAFPHNLLVIWKDLR